jgi:hypothetical protein
MDPARKRRLALGALALVLVGVLVWFLQPAPKKTRAATLAAKFPGPQSAQVEPASGDWPTPGTSATPPASHMAEKNRLYVEVEAQRIADEEARLSKIDFDMPRPDGPGALIVEGKAERAMSGEEKAAQSERVMLLLNRRITRVTQRAEEAERAGDTTKAERAKMLAQRLQARVTELDAIAKQQRGGDRTKAAASADPSHPEKSGEQDDDDEDPKVE